MFIRFLQINGLPLWIFGAVEPMQNSTKTLHDESQKKNKKRYMKNNQFESIIKPLGNFIVIL